MHQLAVSKFCKIFQSALLQVHLFLMPITFEFYQDSKQVQHQQRGSELNFPGALYNVVCTMFNLIIGHICTGIIIL